MRIFLLIVCAFLSLNTSAQKALRGRITDENGEAAIGCTVYLKYNSKISSSTDLDGNYSLKITDSSSVVVIVKYIGYQQIESKVKLVENVTLKDFQLQPTALEMKEVVIESKATKSKEYFMERVKTNSTITLDYISNETMKKIGDSNISSAISRVAGVSTSGAFITVRGIGDRYIKTSINNCRIPTLDPFTNNLKLDLFPSNLIDNVVISKTASAENPSDWAGALIDIQTKDFPDKLTVNVESTVGYNTQASLRNIISSEKSSTDWLGYDNGYRERDHDNFVSVNNKITKYQILSELGLKDYYASMGIDNNTPWNDTYFKLGLVKLGYLKLGDFDNSKAFLEAKKGFDANNTNYDKAYRQINAAAIEQNKSFKDNWDTKRTYCPLNVSQSVSFGNQNKIKEAVIGYLVSFRYSKNYQYDSLSTINRAAVDAQNNKGVSSRAFQQISKETNTWSGLMNASIKLKKNSFSLLYLPSTIGVNNVRSAVDDADDVYFLLSKNQFYESRKLNTSQFKSEHFVSKTKLKINSFVSYTKGKSNAPDFKNIQYLKLKGTDEYQIAGSLPINRFYRYLNENMLDAKIDFEQPIFRNQTLNRKLKFGGSYLQQNRQSDQYNYSLNFGQFADLNLYKNDLNAFFDPKYFDVTNGTFNGQNYTTVNKYYEEDGLYSNHTIGKSSISSAYLLSDYSLSKKLKINAGVRFEKISMHSDVNRYDSLGYAANDQRRFQANDFFLVNPGQLDTSNFFPSASIIYKLVDNEESPSNLRFNYSKTTARPSLREITETVVFDYELRDNVFGNSKLKAVYVNNLDFRYEKYFGKSYNISASLFYKNFKNHIELIQTGKGYTWENVDKSTLKGIEIEGKATFFNSLEVRSNITICKSMTTFMKKEIIYTSGIKSYITDSSMVSRSMFGQAPYTINAIVSYKFDSINAGISVSYNRQGPRLSVASNLPFTDLNSANKNLPYLPDVYEMPRNIIDVRAYKNIGKHWMISVSVRDILNAPIKRTYLYKDGTELDYDKIRFGTVYQLAIQYKI